ncbi:hypothetical protein R1sor_027260 [Riccia sorocarpa]|uniref:Uncharacterized protein n=1 Tax=Riccia sorocarpa TaxID=122646 RepID=A0ABD3GDP1_9MARC
MDERMGLLPPPGTPPESAGGGGVAELDGTAAAARSNNNKDTVTSAHMRRKKWSEEEEESLISKYGELLRVGTLHRLKTREKKFEPIAAYVNSLHHFQDKVSFPWKWTWRDLSVKIQNMRHQYLGAKQKIRRPPDPKRVAGDQDEYDWNEGIVHWSNFLKYKEVFGDLELEPNEILPRGSPGATTNNGKLEGKGHRVRNRVSNNKSKMRLFNNGNTSRVGAESGSGFLANSGGGGAILEKAAAGDDGAPVLSLEGDDWEDEEDDARNDDNDFEGSKRKKRKGNQGRVLGENGGGGCLLSERKLLAFLGAYIADQREREAQREVREREKEREREDKEKEREDAERERERYRLERERMLEEQQRRLESEREERERAREMLERERWEEEKQRERAWEEKREKEKQEWIERMTALQLEHQASMMQMQAQMVQSQQNMVSLLLGFFLHGSQVGDNSGQRNSSIGPLAAQVLRNLQQLSAATGQGAERKAGIENATHFIVDGETMGVTCAQLGVRAVACWSFSLSVMRTDELLVPCVRMSV